MNIDFQRGILQTRLVQLFTIVRLAVVASLSAILTCCETLPKKGEKSESEEPAETTPQSMKIPIGTIHHVDTAGGFVLIRSSRQFDIDSGTLITVFGDQGETAATLKVSPARKGQFLTADILSGVPKSGQQAAMDYDPSNTHDPGAAGVPGQTAGSDVQVLE